MNGSMAICQPSCNSVLSLLLNVGIEIPECTLYCSRLCPLRFLIVVNPNASASDNCASPNSHNCLPGCTNLMVAFKAFCAALIKSVHSLDPTSIVMAAQN